METWITPHVRTSPVWIQSCTAVCQSKEVFETLACVWIGSVPNPRQSRSERKGSSGCQDRAESETRKPSTALPSSPGGGKRSWKTIEKVRASHPAQRCRTWTQRYCRPAETLTYTHTQSVRRPKEAVACFIPPPLYPPDTDLLVSLISPQRESTRIGGRNLDSKPIQLVEDSFGLLQHFLQKWTVSTAVWVSDSLAKPRCTIYSLPISAV
ncbi:hypothetical protein EOD39_14072 [Acipenser ruthenus]|uniref:Uncharacterized protein n=1 Tax=Acipenser ruthenus TaxID=7906 RepID=A0A662YQI4_ACIRT|nr:hypothetical protein EOD39_14072 [Acipenser ruthenus]